MRRYNIKGTTTKPHHPEQNPSEREIQDVKEETQTLIDRTGADSRAWFIGMDR